MIYDHLMRLLATICIDSPFECLSGFVAFRATFTIYVVERNVVAYCHAYTYVQQTEVDGLVQMNFCYTSKLFL